MGPPGERLRIFLSGMIAAIPDQGGATWAVLQYVLGFERLGHEVIFVEELDGDLLRPAGAELAASENGEYFRAVTSRFGIDGRSSLLLRDTSETVGLPHHRLLELARDADVLFNIAGTLSDDALLEEIPSRVYLDLDPAFSQLWDEEGIDIGLAGHDRFVTVGQSIGEADCRIPTGGRDWLKSLPPVVLGHWPSHGEVRRNAFTTVGNWRAYGSIERGGLHYGQKAHSLRQYMSLPKRTTEVFLLALAIHPEETKDIEALAENGWQVVDAAEVTGTPDSYADFIRSSKAEFGIAKSGYVVSRSGWFSDRSACYLASGRPVVAQETGFSRFLPTGEGLFTFETAEQALGAIERVGAEYERHSRAARLLAEEVFDSDRVLTRLLENVAATPIA